MLRTKHKNYTALHQHQAPVGRRAPQLPPRHRVVRTRSSVALPLKTIRFVLAIAVLLLVISICVVALIVPNTIIIDKLLPFVMPPLTLILHHYFGRQGRE